MRSLAPVSPGPLHAAYSEVNTWSSPARYIGAGSSLGRHASVRTVTSHDTAGGWVVARDAATPQPPDGVAAAGQHPHYARVRSLSFARYINGRRPSSSGGSPWAVRAELA